jgi:type I restriction enzyme, S subunit
MNGMSIDVSPEHWQIVLDILARLCAAKEISVFGSRATGTSKQYSDLDLVIIGEQRLSLSELADLTNAFAESDLPYKVDIVDWASISESFQKIIKETAVPVTKVIPAGP